MKKNVGNLKPADYNPRRMPKREEDMMKALEANRENAKEIPAYAHDVHTPRGRAQGKTKKDFFKEEFAALKPRQPGLFDEDVAKL